MQAAPGPGTQRRLQACGYLLWEFVHPGASPEAGMCVAHVCGGVLTSPQLLQDRLCTQSTESEEAQVLQAAGEQS